MTEKELIEIGFKLSKQYKYDGFNTNRYYRGILEVEFTYQKEKLLCTELTIMEVNCMSVDLGTMKVLTEAVTR